MLFKYVCILFKLKLIGNKYCFYDIVEEEMLIIKVFVVIFRYFLRC